MSQPISRPMSLDAFFAWQERQDVRYELVGGVPLQMMAGAKNRHDDIVANILVALGNKLRGGGCRPFTGDGAVETYPGQIRRPDAGVDCGRRDPEAYTAADPRLVVEVMSPSTRDFDTVAKLAEYKSIASLEHIVYVEPLRLEVVAWSREPESGWRQEWLDDLSAQVELTALGITLPLAEIYDGIAFPPGPRLHQPRWIDAAG